jgi:chromosome partitioning protein
MLVMSVLSLKGGVGKTTLVLGLAGAALERGLRALVVDLDPQANATTALDPKDVTFTANDVLADARAGVLKEAVTMSGWGEEVQVIAAEPALEHRNRPEGKGSELRLRKAMNGTPSAYDLVLIDTPPSLGELTKNALAASQRALVVAEPSLFALQGAQQALDAVDVVRRGFNLRLRTIGIVANRVRPTSEHRFRLDELATAYGDLVFDPAMLDRSAVMQAQGACVPVQRWHSRGARAASQVLSTYLDRVLATTVGDGPSLMGRR